MLRAEPVLDILDLVGGEALHLDGERVLARQIGAAVALDRAIERHDPLADLHASGRIDRRHVGVRGYDHRHVARGAQHRPGIVPRQLLLEQRLHVDLLDRGLAFALAEAQLEVDVLLDAENLEARLGDQLPGIRPGEVSRQLNAEQLGVAGRDRHPDRKADREAEPAVDDQRIEIGAALGGEACLADAEIGEGAELDAVRGQREVAAECQLERVAGIERDRQPLEPGEARGRVERRMEAAEGDQKARLAVELHAHRHVAGDEKARDLRAAQRGVDLERALGDVERAGERGVELEDRRGLVRQHRPQRAEQRDGQRLGQLDRDPHVDLDERGRAPADLDHRAEDVLIRHRRKDRVDLGEDPHGIRHRILGKQDVIERAGAYRIAQRILVQPAVDADQPADAVQREAEAELHADKPRREAQEHRPSAARQLGVDDADGGDRDLQEIEIQDTGVAIAVGVDVENPAAGNGPCVDHEAYAIGRPKSDVELEDARVAGTVFPKLEIDAEPHMLDGKRECRDLWRSMP